MEEPRRNHLGQRQLRPWYLNPDRWQLRYRSRRRERLRRRLLPPLSRSLYTAGLQRRRQERDRALRDRSTVWLGSPGAPSRIVTYPAVVAFFGAESQLSGDIAARWRSRGLRRLVRVCCDR